MGLLDSLKGMVGEVEAAAPGLIQAALATTQSGDLSGLAAKLEAGGFGEQVKSWLSTGSNLKITPDQIRSVLGNDEIQNLAKHFGLPVDEALQFMAEHLPATVDKASPNGTLAPSA